MAIIHQPRIDILIWAEEVIGSVWDGLPL